MSSTSVIIVGGGPAGFFCAQALQKADESISVTIINRGDYMDWSLSTPRSVCAPEDADKHGYTFPLDKVCEFVGATAVHANVTQIDPKADPR